MSDSVMFDSRDVAAYIAQQCQKNNISYNNTKIQKLLYCVYGVMLAWKDARICDEYPRLWPYGPVFPRVFKFINAGKEIAGFSDNFQNRATDDEKLAVTRVLEKFGKFSAGALSQWSHNPTSPWSRVKNEGAGWNSFIPDEYIAEYFKERVLA